LKGLFSKESNQSSGNRRIFCHDFGCFTGLFVGFLLKYSTFALSLVHMTRVSQQTY
jgi:hypothetical protein